MSDLLICGGLGAMLVIIILWYASGASKEAKKNREALERVTIDIETDPETKRLIRALILIIALLMIGSWIYFMFFWTV